MIATSSHTAELHTSVPSLTWLNLLITCHSRMLSLIPAGFISGLSIKIVLYPQLLVNWESPSHSMDKSKAPCIVWSHFVLELFLSSLFCITHFFPPSNSLTAMNENMHAWLRIWSPLVLLSQRIWDDMLFECHLEVSKRTTVQKDDASASTYSSHCYSINKGHIWLFICT